jgi:hypothetical protein
VSITKFSSALLDLGEFLELNLLRIGCILGINFGACAVKLFTVAF